MATKQQTKDEGFEIHVKGSEELEALRAQRQALGADVYEKLEAANQVVYKLGTATSEGELAEVSKLKEAVMDFADFKGTMADQALGVTASLDDLLGYAEKSQLYQGMEWWAHKFFFRKTADRWRDERIREQDLSENLEEVVQRGRTLYVDLSEARVVMYKAAKELAAQDAVLTKKIAEYQPKQEAQKQLVDATQEQLEALEKRMEGASEAERADLVEERNAVELTLAEQRHEYMQLFTTYKQAQEMLEANRAAKAMAYQMQEDLAVQAKTILEKIDNATTLYKTVPVVGQALMTTQGTEVVNEAFDVATQRSLRMFSKAAKGIRDATLQIMEKQATDPGVMRAVYDEMADTSRDYIERFEEIDRIAALPPEERYDVAPADIGTPGAQP